MIPAALRFFREVYGLRSLAWVPIVLAVVIWGWLWDMTEGDR